MKRHVLSYLAGAMDSDGTFGIRKSTYSKRVRGDATQAVYFARIALKQVTPQIPNLLHDTFGGTLRTESPSCKRNGRPLYLWQATNKMAVSACRALAPLLLLKVEQARTIIELDESRSAQYLKLSYWWEKENPNWVKGELIDVTRAAAVLGMSKAMIRQAMQNGSLLGLPYTHRGTEVPRLPMGMVAAYKEHMAKAKDGRGRCRPLQLIEWRERLWQTIRRLNKIGVDGTQVYRREGCHALA